MEELRPVAKVRIYAVFRSDRGNSLEICEGEIIEEFRKGFCARFEGTSPKWTFLDRDMGRRIFTSRKAAEEKIKEMKERKGTCLTHLGNSAAPKK